MKAVLLRVPVSRERSSSGRSFAASMRDADAFDDTAFLGLARSAKRDPYRLSLFAYHLDPDERPLIVLPVQGGTLLVTDDRLLELRAHLEVHGAWNVNHVQGLTQGPSRFLAKAFLEVHPRQVRVGVEVAAISRRRDRPLEPGDRFIEAFELDQIRPDIVVRIPERRVHFDRALALLDRGVVATHETEGPSVERMRLRGRLEPDRPFVGVRGPLELPGTLEDVRRLERAPSRVLARLLCLVERARVEGALRERLVHDVAEMLVVMARDAAFPGVGQEVFHGEQPAEVDRTDVT